MITPNENNDSEPKFELGQAVATPAAIEALESSGESPDSFIRRHHTGDWGDVCDDDALANEEALHVGFRIFSVYHTAKGVKLYITEQDRSSTCILLPEDY